MLVKFGSAGLWDLVVLCVQGCQERDSSPGGCRGPPQRCPWPSHQRPPRSGRASPPAGPPLGQEQSETGDRGWRNVPPSLKIAGKAAMNWLSKMVPGSEGSKWKN